jgi:hypothetical protein
MEVVPVEVMAQLAGTLTDAKRRTFRKSKKDY